MSQLDARLGNEQALLRNYLTPRGCLFVNDKKDTCLKLAVISGKQHYPSFRLRRA